MPRSASPPYNFSVPSGTAAVSGAVISSTAYNAFLADLTNNALNAAWPVAYGGNGTTDGSALVPDGGAAAPAVRFQNETNTGIYRPGAGELDISVLGTKRVAVTATGLAVTGTITATGTTIAQTSLSNEPFYNLTLSATVAASALTIAIKGQDGNDPSSTNPVIVNFRSATASSGLLAQLILTAATSIVVSSGSTLGMTSGIAATLVVVGFNDAGTFRPGIINPLLLPLLDSIASSTAEGGAGAADSAGVFYTETAVTSKSYTVLGFITITEATAGTWASGPTTTQVGSSAIVSNALPYVTPWVTYTPTFTGYGTAASVSMWSRRVGDTLEVRGKFTSGTPTGVEARISLGFNGTDGNVTSSATKVASIQLAGDIVSSAAGATTLYALIESAVGYLTLGAQSAALAALTKQNGNVVFVAGNVISIVATVPISGW